jgi:hypothetical protein
LAPAEPIGPEQVGDLCHLDRRTGAADQHPRPSIRKFGRRHPVGAEQEPARRQGHRPDARRAADGEGDMDRPVFASFRIFASPVERIDDPDPRSGQPRRAVGALLGEDRVVRPPLREAGQDEVVGDPVGGAAERRAGQDRVLALGEKQAPRLGCQMRGKILVGQSLLPREALNRVNGLFTIHRITTVPAGAFSRGD